MKEVHGKPGRKADDEFLGAWRELQAAIRSAPREELRELVKRDLDLDLARGLRELSDETTRLIRLAQAGEAAALPVLRGGCQKMREAVEVAPIPQRRSEEELPEEELFFGEVRENFQDAVDHVVDLVRVGEPGALDVLFDGGIRIAEFLAEDARSGCNPDADSSAPTPEVLTQGGAEVDWQSRVDRAIAVIAGRAKEVGSVFSNVVSRLPESQFQIRSLSPSLPPFDPDDRYVQMLYELCDRLVAKRLSSKVSLREGLRILLNDPALPAPGAEIEERVQDLVVPSRLPGSPTEFAGQVYKHILGRRTRRFTDEQLSQFKLEAEERARLGGPILKHLKAAKAEGLKRKWEEDFEKWVSFRSPEMILDQLVALLPSLSKNTTKQWIDAGVANVFVWCDGEFEHRGWPEAVMSASRSTGGLPSAIRKVLTQGFNTLAAANDQQ